MNRKNMCVIFFLFFVACATKSQQIWESIPSTKTIQHDFFTAEFEPIKTESPFFSLFKLTVKNNASSDVEIDWNNTRYIFNKTTQGRFAFSGIEPKDIKESTIPADIIHPGETLSKMIAPVNLVAFKPLRSRNAATSKSSILPGMIPAGENGIYLFIRYDDKEIKTVISVTIEANQ